MNEEPIKAQEVQYWTKGQLFEKDVEELKRRMGLPSNIVEAGPTTDHVTDTSKLIKEAKDK